MNKERLQEIKIEWEKLNEDYDNLIRNYLDNPEKEIVTEDQFVKCKEMQQKLFDLETELFQTYNK